MCGITGFIDSFGSQDNTSLSRIVQAMTDTLAHRGPDSDGIWTDVQAGVALGHRRLAILDLSIDGHQPMVSISGRYIIVYNGEIYNFRDLRDRLQKEGKNFKGRSDTEILLTAIETWGLEKTLIESNGMFAFALWDRQTNILSLARDRLGKKPLYYGWAGNSFMFASELKAFHCFPKFKPEIDRGVLAVYCRYNYVPAPWSIYKNIYKLPPASFLSLKPQHLVTQDGPLTASQYWDISVVARQGITHSLNLSDKRAIDELEHILTDAVGRRMIADVPLGAFLSGGIDSSLVVALMQKQSTRPVQTFSIGFEDAGFNEAKYARAVASHLGTEHTEFYITAKEALDTISDLPFIFDEPFADPSQIPTCHVSRLSRQKVTVALSGDGGDEAFAGYGRYAWDMRASMLLKIPSPLRQTAAELMKKNIPEKLQAALRAGNVSSLYQVMMSYWQYPDKIVLDAIEPPVAMANAVLLPSGTSQINVMMLADMRTYLPDDILAKVDRASMAVGLETRAPLLDYKVIEYAWQLPLSLKRRNGQGKWILRQLLARHIPSALFERPKQGFGIPHSQWLRGPLRSWAESLLDEKRLKTDGFFDPVLSREIWCQHLAGQDHGYKLWGLLMFQAWHERWGG